MNLSQPKNDWKTKCQTEKTNTCSKSKKEKLENDHDIVLLWYR